MKNLNLQTRSNRTTNDGVEGVDVNIGVISLGCDKNRVDTEKVVARLIAAGHGFVADIEDADVIIVNTCAFINSAKEESIDEILNAVSYKERGKRVIVTGCLAQRYMEALKEEFPEVDAFLGVADYDKIEDAICAIEEGGRFCSAEGKDAFYCERALTTSPHVAYLKIADGCNNRCTYCAIPSIRGAYRSEKLDDLLKEAQKLAENGVRELILVAQDVTRYGVDLYGEPRLKELVRALEQLDFDMIRLLYLEPEMVDDSLIEFVKTEQKVAKYMDIPLQHVDSAVLKRMNRHTDEAYTRALVKKVKDAGITLRSTFICGFPGESEDAFKKLYDFIAEGNIDFAGFFAYSREEGTPADRMRGHLPEEVKEERVKKLAELQTKIIRRNCRALVGSVLDVTYEDIDYDKQAFRGRAAFQAPDVDNVVLFSSDFPVDVGCDYKVLITSVKGVDLVGKTLPQDV